MPRTLKAPEPLTPPSSAPNLYVGTSGWAYPTWKPVFYPAGVPARSFLQYYATQLTAVEVNYTFRALPTVQQIETWQAAVPPGFRFSFKAPQRITHFSRLRECETLVKSFLDVLAPMQAGRLGPVLFQLPPNFQANRDLLGQFLALPAFRQSHVQLAFEFRHSSWLCEDIFSLLREHNVALCVAETEDLSTPDVQTATHRCYRLRRPGGYPQGELEKLAETFAAEARKGEIYVFFMHEDQPTGALNAAYLQRRAAELAAPSKGGGQG